MVAGTRSFTKVVTLLSFTHKSLWHTSCIHLTRKELEPGIRQNSISIRLRSNKTFNNCFAVDFLVDKKNCFEFPNFFEYNYSSFMIFSVVLLQRETCIVERI